jgi:hypothetical protein
MNKDDIENSIKCDIECKICYNKFIKLTNKQYDKFLKDYKHLLPNTFESDTCCLIYEDRFECLICKDVIICQSCYWSLKNHKFKPNHEHIEDYEYFNELDSNGFAVGCPGVDCPIICPFCKQKDYKIYYENRVPYELLTDIRNRRL